MSIILPDSPQSTEPAPDCASLTITMAKQEHNESDVAALIQSIDNLVIGYMGLTPAT